MTQMRVVPPAEFAAAAVAAFLDALRGLSAPVLGLPTGRTMEPMYEHLRRCTFPVQPADAFAIDEYCWADAAHPGLNAAFFARMVVDGPLPVVHVPRADAIDPAAAIGAHCQAIDACGGLDLVVLGIGENGHIAFNEPGSAEDAPCRVVRLAAATRAQLADSWAESPSFGMTIGMMEILAAKRVVLLANGVSKQAVLAAALRGPRTAALPASLLQGHPNLRVVVDHDAAGQL